MASTETIDKAEVLRRLVELHGIVHLRREDVGALISKAPWAAKLHNREQLDRIYPQGGEIIELPKEIEELGDPPRAVRPVEHADVQLVYDKIVKCRRPVPQIMPSVGVGVAQNAIAMRPIMGEFARIGIALPTGRPLSFDPKLILIALLSVRNESRPIIAVPLKLSVARRSLAPAVHPSVEITTESDLSRARGPTAEGGSGFIGNNVCSHRERVRTDWINDGHS